MAPSKKEESRGSAPPKINESRISAGRSGIRGTVAAAGAAGVLVGAVGAFVWKWWSTTENHHQSCSGYVVHSRIKVRVLVCCWPVVEILS